MGDSHSGHASRGRGDHSVSPLAPPGLTHGPHAPSLPLLLLLLLRPVFIFGCLIFHGWFLNSCLLLHILIVIASSLLIFLTFPRFLHSLPLVLPWLFPSFLAPLKSSQFPVFSFLPCPYFPLFLPSLLSHALCYIIFTCVFPCSKGLLPHTVSFD